MSLLRPERAQFHEEWQAGIRLCRRKARKQFLVFRRERNDEVICDGVVARARNYLRIVSANFDFQFTKAAVKVLARAVISQRITRPDFLVYPLQSFADVISALDKSS